ncbi:hypothetical protein [Emticicia sp. SJ17W-69]|uniref:hypothetical protein n=1 Tax=Emticicia sp. SJ17W-69 TaxID=3421657 RepID=UPI003EBC1F15
MKTISFIFLCLLLNVKSFAGIVILNGLTHQHDVTQGNTIIGKIKVQNNGKKEARIMIYHQDLKVSCNSQIEYDTINSHTRSLGHWIKSNVEEKLLQSDEIYDITYSVSIPQNLKQLGSYWSVIMIEGADPIKEDEEKGVKIDSKVRYAIQVMVNVGTVESSKINFENIDLTTKDNSVQVLNVKLKNEGIYISKAKLSLEVYDDSGKNLSTFESSLRKIYPNKCNTFEIIINGLPKGKYNGVLIADNGKDLYGANITLITN